MANTAVPATTDVERAEAELAAEPESVDPWAEGLDVEHDVVVRLLPEIHWVEAQAIFLGPSEPRIVLDVAPWDEE